MKNNEINNQDEWFHLECFSDVEEIRNHIRQCEGRHAQQAVYSTFHDVLTQVCFGCRVIRTNLL